MRHSLKGLSLGLVPEWLLAHTHTHAYTLTHMHTLSSIPPAHFFYRLEPLINQSVFMLCLSTMAEHKGAQGATHNEQSEKGNLAKQLLQFSCGCFPSPLPPSTVSTASFDECPQANLNPNTEYGIL